jgi:hypothetical protein
MALKSPKKAGDGDQKQASYEEGYHPAELHPMNENHSGDEAKDFDEKRSTSSDPRPESHGSISSNGPESPKKVKFKEKMTGGAKVFMGTLGRNHGKVEAGKKLWQGEV